LLKGPNRRTPVQDGNIVETGIDGHGRPGEIIGAATSWRADGVQNPPGFDNPGSAITSYFDFRMGTMFALGPPFRWEA
jgi:hypothetical protein